MATHPEHSPTESSTDTAAARAQPRIPESSKTQSPGTLVRSKTAAALPQPPTLAHLEGTVSKQGQQREGNRHEPCSAKQTSLTVIPPAPGKHFPFVGDSQDVRGTTGHLHHLVAQQGLHNLGLAGEEQQPSAQTSQPARLLPSLPPGPPRLNTALAASQFSSNTNNTEISFFFFFCSKQSSKG